MSKPEETLPNVIPAQAGIYDGWIFLDSRLRGSGGNRMSQSFPNVSIWVFLSGFFLHSVGFPTAVILKTTNNQYEV